MSASKKVIVVLTFKSTDEILGQGGSGWWKLKPSNAEQCDFVVCARNRKDKRHPPEGSEAHASAFLIGRVTGVVAAKDTNKRHMIEISEYAEISVPDAWDGGRNPVRYTTLDDLDIDVDRLEFKPMPERTRPLIAGREEEEADDGDAGDRPLKLTIDQAKRGLSAALGVPVDAIEITIRA